MLCEETRTGDEECEWNTENNRSLNKEYHLLSRHFIAFSLKFLEQKKLKIYLNKTI